VQRHGDDRGVVTLEGELDLYTVSELKAGLIELERAGIATVAVDLRGTRLVDGVALGALGQAQRRLAALGGALLLVCDRPDLAKAIAIAGLDEVLRPYPDVETAFAAAPSA